MTLSLKKYMELTAKPIEELLAEGMLEGPQDAREVIQRLNSMGLGIQIKPLDEIPTYPGVVVQEGDTYVFVHSTNTRAGHVHKVGSELRVLKKTTYAPHGEIGQDGNGNWECETKHGVSIWATLESCIDRGLLRKKDAT